MIDKCVGCQQQKEVWQIKYVPMAGQKSCITSIPNQQLPDGSYRLLGYFKHCQLCIDKYGNSLWMMVVDEPEKPKRKKKAIKSTEKFFMAY